MNAQTGVLIDLCTEPDPNYSESKRDAVFTAPAQTVEEAIALVQEVSKGTGYEDMTWDYRPYFDK